jgi:LPS export ABC transporter protein LptC
VDGEAVRALWRRVLLWGIPGILLAALAWSFVPQGGALQGGSGGPPAVGAGRAAVAPAPRGEAPAERAARPQRAGALPGDPLGPDGRISTAGAGPPRRDLAGGPSVGAGAASPPAGAPAGEIRTGTFVGTDAGGHRRWQITADDVLLARGRQVVVLRNVRATFYSPDGTAMTVTGARGRYDTQTREVEIAGGVHGVAANGREIFADALRYAPAGGRLWGTGHVRVIEERVIMYADHMVSNTALGQTRFFGDVHMTVR